MVSLLKYTESQKKLFLKELIIDLYFQILFRGITNLNIETIPEIIDLLKIPIIRKQFHKKSLLVFVSKCHNLAVA